MAKLNPKQQKFVEEYMVDMNATAAAKRAGYAEGSAHVAGARLLNNDKVQKVIADSRMKRSKKVARTAQDAINDIVRLAAMAEEKGDLKTAIRGFELEAKHHGGFIERKADVLTDGTDAPKEISVKFVEPGSVDG